MIQHLTHALLFLLVVCLSATSTAGQSDKAFPSPSSTPATSRSDVDSRLDNLEERVQQLRKSPKDNWDRLAAISGVASGTVVAVLGLLGAWLVNRNRWKAEDEQRRKELAVIQAQTVQSFMPQLESRKTKEVEAALLTIAALGNPKLATELAGIYRSEGSVSALRKIRASSDAEAADLAKQSLEQMFTVDLEKLSKKTEKLYLPANGTLTVNDLTNEVFWALDGAVRAFTYETVWILRDKDSGELIKKVGRTDSRPLDAVGIGRGTRLEAIPFTPANATVAPTGP